MKKETMISKNAATTSENAAMISKNAAMTSENAAMISKKSGKGSENFSHGAFAASNQSDQLLI